MNQIKRFCLKPWNSPSPTLCSQVLSFPLPRRERVHPSCGPMHPGVRAAHGHMALALPVTSFLSVHCHLSSNSSALCSSPGGQGPRLPREPLRPAWGWDSHGAAGFCPCPSPGPALPTKACCLAHGAPTASNHPMQMANIEFPEQFPWSTRLFEVP